MSMKEKDLKATKKKAAASSKASKKHKLTSKESASSSSSKAVTQTSSKTDMGLKKKAKKSISKGVSTTTEEKNKSSDTCLTQTTTSITTTSTTMAATTTTDSQKKEKKQKNKSGKKLAKKGKESECSNSGENGNAASIEIQVEKKSKKVVEISSNWKALQQKDPNLKRKRVEREQKGKLEGGKNKRFKKGEEVWFDDVSAEVIQSSSADGNNEKKDKTKGREAWDRLNAAASASGAGSTAPEVLNKLITGSFTGLTKYVAMDCEMVGVGPNGSRSVLARCSIVNAHGRVLYDKFVKPQEKVTDYRTFVSGVTKESLKDAVLFKQAQKEIADILKDRVVVGHALKNDFDALLFTQAKHLVRDTSLYKPFRAEFGGGRSPSLRKLAKLMLNIDIQGGSHSSVEDARAALQCYRLRRVEWEAHLRQKKVRMPKKKKSKKAGDPPRFLHV
eukprot:Nk52_evm116s151 gene=Nk52_evmTU116s151